MLAFCDFLFSFFRILAKKVELRQILMPEVKFCQGQILMQEGKRK